MVNQILIKQAKSLKELLQLYFPIELYEYTKKITLDESFLNHAKRWPDATLDFSPYKDLEIITLAGKTTSLIFKTTEYPPGEIRKINVSKNKNLKELILPNQELEWTLDLSANSQLEKINIANNLLNQLKVHGNFSQKLKEQLSEEEIREICQLKVEITKLKIELEEWQVEETQHETL